MGMSQAGWECKFQIENDKNCQSILRKHWSDVPKWGDILEVNGANLPLVDCIIFGSPCQNLSTSGKRAGINGDKSKLFFEATRIIQEMRDATNNEFPKWAIWENVAGALNSNKGADFGQVLDTLAETGAVVIEWRLLNSRYFGIPQHRRRVFVVAGYNSDAIDRSTCQIFSFKESNTRDIQSTDKTCTIPTGKEVSFYKSQGKLDGHKIGESVPLKAIAPVCIDTEVSHPRALTPTEHERLQGYPDDHTKYRDDGKEQKDTVRYKQIGNGVSAPVARWVGEQVMLADSILAGKKI